MKKLYTIILLVLFAITPDFIYSQDEDKFESITREEIMQMSLEDLLALPFEDLLVLANKLGVSIDDLLKMKTTVASKTVLTPRETPGIISIITEEEIKNSGARDLIDVLRLVPGFDFGQDVVRVIGLGMRGNWVHEGKLLLMIDNQEINDLLYSNNAFGNHFSVEQIKRIEIIRGPGSAMYGGSAELGVINIITKKGEDLKGIEASATIGQLNKINGRNNYNILLGSKINDWDISVKGFIGRGNKSEENDISFLLDTVDFSKGGAKTETENINIGINNKNMSARFIYDNYANEYTWWGWHTMSEFKTYLGEIKYKFELNEKLNITPLVSYKNTTPFYEEGWYKNIREERYKGNVTATYNPIENLSVISGIEYYKDRGWMFEDSLGAYFYYDTTKNDVSFHNSSIFVQGVYKINRINIVAGTRAEWHNYYGNAFAPRLGITGIFSNFHFKLLYSRAFRAPALGNIDVSVDLKTEYTDVTELELGYKLNANNFFTINLYDITIHDPILYFEIDPDVPRTGYGYRNAGSSGSTGIELEYKSMYNWGSLAFNYSHYTVSNKSVPELYSIPGNDKQVLALSPNKISFLGIYKITNNFSVSPSMNYYDKRYGYGSPNGFPDSIIVKKFDPYLLLNINFLYSNMLIKGLDFSLGVFDILNKKPPMLQPYNGGWSPYPGRSREFVASVKYRFKVN